MTTSSSASGSKRQKRLPSSMRAAVYHSFGGRIGVEEVPVPPAPAGGVLLEVKATGVCRSDWHGWRGHDSDIEEHGLPFTPGHELSGVVAAVGEGVTQFAVGDRVAVPFILSCGDCRECRRQRPTVCEQQQQPGFTMPGSFAEFVALPRAESLCLLPEAVTFAAAAALGCRTTTAFRAIVQQGRLARGETLAVFGCGGLGLSCVMIGVAHGARVLAVDTNAAARAKAVALGASAAVDATRGDDETRRAVRELTGGAGADLAVDAAGFTATCENAVWCARRAGRMVQVGLPLRCAPSIPMARVAGWEIEIIGSHGMAAADFPAVLALVADGKLQPELLVEREVGLEEGAAAIEAMDTSSPLGITMVTRSAHFPLHARRFVVGVDDAAQLRVAARMKERANVSRPDYVLNAGDNFYWGGITTHCGQPASEHVATGQWRGVFEDVYTAPGLEGQWLGVLGNHDYGGYIFSAGWDQVIGYTWRGPASSGRWLTPAQYWSTTAHYPGFSVDYFFVDTNVFLALNPDTDPDHNICSLKHNAEGPHMPDTCGSQGPKSTWDCPGWFGGLWAAQIEWLDGKLATSAAEWQIVVTHFPPTFGREEWSYLAERHGIDLMVTGHKHQQEVHYLEPPMNLTAWIVSGGGGGITSEGVPDVDGNDDMYGFFDLSLTPAEIVVEAISHSGVVRSRTRVARRYPCPACYQVPTYTKTTVTAVTSTRTSTSQTSTLSGTSTGTSAVTSTVTNTGTSTAIASADAPEARSSIFASLLAAALFGDADQDATAGRAGTLDDPLVVA